MVYPLMKRPAKSGKSLSAYETQPRHQKWTCSKCGRIPVKEKRREKGQPRFELISFRNKAGLERHVFSEH